MVSTFTPNVQLEEPARGDDVGTWDTPVNGNTTNLDLLIGAINTISLNNSNVALSASQYRSRNITFNSTLTGSVTITFPTSFTKSYEIQNLCTGSSAFLITLATTAAGGQVIACPFGATFDCFNDGTNIKFKNLQPVGTYLDYAGGGIPAWISNCTIPPYLDCNAQAFSSATYPTLAVLLGQTTVPDFRGRAGYYLNEGTGRLTAAGAGINGDSNFQVGGSNGVVLTTGQIPTINSQGSNNIVVADAANRSFPVTPAGNAITSNNGGPLSGSNSFFPGSAGGWNSQNQLTGSNTISVNTVGTGAGTPVGATAPGIVSGIRMIRAG